MIHPISKVKNLESLIRKKQWDELISNYPASELCQKISFEKAMLIMQDFFYYNFTNDSLQGYAVDLGFEIRKVFQNEWKSDWKNEAYLGNMCSLYWRYDDQYDCFKAERIEELFESIFSRNLIEKDC